MTNADNVLDSQALPMVSIGIPTFNRASTLKRALESALHQDYNNLEIVISDNGSTDDTQSLCEKYAWQHRIIKYYRSGENRGPLYNFHNVLEKSQGEFFMWLADDDYIDRNYVSECLKVLMANKSVVVVGGRAKSFGGKYNGLGHKFNIISNNALARLCNYYWSPKDNSIFYGVMRSNAAKTNQMKSALAADWEYMAGMAFQGGLITIDGPLIHKESGGASESPKKIIELLGLRKINSYFIGTSIAISTAGDILRGNHVYKNLPKSQRLLYAYCVFFVNIFSHGLLRNIRALRWYVLKNLLGDDNYIRLKNWIKSRAH